MILDIEIFIRLLVAAVAGGLVGFERKRVHKPAGLRTHMLVCLGAALFTIVSVITFASADTSRIIADPSRIVAGIVTGIGFLGAGTIFRSKNHIKGLTTAASLWSVAAIGIAVGLGEYFLMAVATVLVILILQLNNLAYFREI